MLLLNRIIILILMVKLGVSGMKRPKEETSDLYESGMSSKAGKSQKKIILMKENQQIELIDFYLWLDQDGKKAIDEQTPPDGKRGWFKGDRPQLKKEAEEAIKLIAGNHVSPNIMRKHFRIPREDVIKTVGFANHGIGHAEPFSEERMNGLREKMVKEFEENQMKKNFVGAFHKFYVQIKWDGHVQMETFRFKLALNYEFNKEKHVQHAWTEHYDVAIFQLPKIIELKQVNDKQIKMTLDIWLRNDDAIKVKPLTIPIEFVTKKFVKIFIQPWGIFHQQLELNLLHPMQKFKFIFKRIGEHHKLSGMRCGTKNWSDDELTVKNDQIEVEKYFELPIENGKVYVKNNIENNGLVNYEGQPCPADKYQIKLENTIFVNDEDTHGVICPEIPSTERDQELEVDYMIGFIKSDDKFECILNNDQEREIIFDNDEIETDESNGSGKEKNDFVGNWILTDSEESEQINDVEKYPGLALLAEMQTELIDFYFWLDPDTLATINESKLLDRSKRIPWLKRKEDLKAALHILVRNKCSRRQVSRQLHLDENSLDRIFGAKNYNISIGRAPHFFFDEKKMDGLREDINEEFEANQRKKLNSSHFYKFYVKIVWNFADYYKMNSFRYKLALNYEFDGEEYVQNAWTEHYDMAVFKLPANLLFYEENDDLIEMSLEIQPRNIIKFIKVESVLLTFNFKKNKVLNINVQPTTINIKYSALNSISPVQKFKFTFENVGNYIGMRCGTANWTGSELQVKNGQLQYEKYQRILKYEGQPCPADKYQIIFKDSEENEVLHGVICPEISTTGRAEAKELEYTISFKNAQQMQCTWKNANNSSNMIPDQVIMAISTDENRSDQPEQLEIAAKRKKIVENASEMEGGDQKMETDESVDEHDEVIIPWGIQKRRGDQRRKATKWGNMGV